jgi:phenylpropionate dioxygenase-like ring-hydroxylating dioxygenase large terminal subunit
LAVLTREQERIESYPGTPAAWYHVLDSDELPRDRPRPVRLAGHELVAFRDARGKAAILDGNCPHLGARLSGGVVDDGCLRCPFHAWRFDAHGCVQSAPYSSQVPKNLKTRAWHVRELAGQVYVWYGGDARPSAPPDYALDPPMELGAMVYRGSKDLGVASTHVIEIVENAGDLRHFDTVHRRFAIPFTPLRIPLVSVIFDASWERDPDREYASWMKSGVVAALAGRRMPFTRARAHIEFIGPGSLLRFHFEREELGKMLLVHTQTPVGPLQLRTRLRWYAEPRVPRPIVWYMVGHWVAQWREDVRIWERKIFQPKPHLIREDGPVLEVRRWYRQFFEAPAPAALRA